MTVTKPIVVKRTTTTKKEKKSDPKKRFGEVYCKVDPNNILAGSTDTKRTLRKRKEVTYAEPKQRRTSTKTSEKSSEKKSKKAKTSSDKKEESK